MVDYIDRQAVVSDFEWCKSQAIDKDRWQEAIDRINVLPSAEITEKDVREWCYRRGLIVIDNTVYYEMQHRWSASV